MFRPKTHLLTTPAISGGGALPTIDPARRAMTLYTSGTTSKPKGVVTTHANIQAQIESLVDAWAWQPDDRIPLFLPLHHIHGIINITSCSLWTDALIEVFPHFNMPIILDRVAAVLQESEQLTLEQLRSWCDDQLSKYKAPKQLLVVDSLPRNAMGEITKPAVSKLFDTNAP